MQSRPQPPHSPLSQWSLTSLLYVISLLSVGMALGGLPGLWPSLLVVGIWWYAFTTPHSVGKILLHVFLIVMLCGCCLGLLMPTTVIRGLSRQAACSNNIRQLSIALHNYESVHGTLPPAFVAGDDGLPKHSWRVLILPYLEESWLYDQYRFDEPWNSDHNKKLSKNIPDVFQCPASGLSNTQTTYKLITGPGTAFVGENTLPISKVADGTANVLWIVEDYSNPIPWMKPEDVDVEQAISALTATGNGPLPHYHQGKFRSQSCAHATSMDHSVFQTGREIDPQLLRRSILVADNFIPDLTAIMGPRMEYHLQSYIALYAYIGLIIAPAFYLKNARRRWCHSPQDSLTRPPATDSDLTGFDEHE